jgi:uncharacterized membrane protein required for colicin V production
METITNNWIDELGERGFMHGIWTDFLNTAETLSLIDYSIILFLVIMALVGLKRGFALGIINLIWITLGLVFASSFYQTLSNGNLFWLFNQQDLNSFIAILALFLLIKLILYKLFKSISDIHGPCPLNRFLAILTGLSIASGISWILSLEFMQLDIIHRLITNPELRIISAFLLTFGTIVTVSFVLIKMLNIKVGIDRPCPLLLALRPLDSILNARNINSGINNFFGLFLGAAKGLMLIILLIIAFNQAGYNTQSTLTQEFYEITANTKTVLADYLTFIRK